LLAAKSNYKDAGTNAGRALELGLKAGDPLLPEPEIRKELASWGRQERRRSLTPSGTV
jgi:hypothetical protein